MMTCQEVQQLIPWYVTGRIKIETAREIAEHLTTCAECQADFVEAAWMRRLLMTSTREAAPRAAVWSRIWQRSTWDRCCWVSNSGSPPRRGAIPCGGLFA
jgi:anti-sigma factor RsiW